MINTIVNSQLRSCFKYINIQKDGSFKSNKFKSKPRWHFDVYTFEQCCRNVIVRVIYELHWVSLFYCQTCDCLHGHYFLARIRISSRYEDKTRQKYELHFIDPAIDIANCD